MRSVSAAGPSATDHSRAASPCWASEAATRRSGVPSRRPTSATRAVSAGDGRPAYTSASGTNPSARGSPARCVRRRTAPGRLRRSARPQAPDVSEMTGHDALHGRAVAGQEDVQQFQVLLRRGPEQAAFGEGREAVQPGALAQVADDLDQVLVAA